MPHNTHCKSPQADLDEHGYAFRERRLAEPLQVLNDVCRLQANRHGCIERVGCEPVRGGRGGGGGSEAGAEGRGAVLELVDVLWPAHGFSDGNKEVSGVPVHGRERLQEDVTVWCLWRETSVQHTHTHTHCVLTTHSGLEAWSSLSCSRCE